MAVQRQRRRSDAAEVPQGPGAQIWRGQQQRQAQESHERACRQRWHALFMAIKATLETVTSGISTIEAEFLANIVLPSTTTAGDWMIPRWTKLTALVRCLRCCPRAVGKAANRTRCRRPKGERRELPESQRERLVHLRSHGMRVHRVLIAAGWDPVDRRAGGDHGFECRRGPRLHGNLEAELA